jgi:hypothetical protein
MYDESGGRKKSIIGTILGGAAVVVVFILSHVAEEGGKLFGEWLGFRLLLPVAVIFLSCWILSKSLNPEIKYLNIAAGIPLGQAIMFSIAILLLGRTAIPIVISDVIIIGVGVSWLLFKPSIFALVFLAAYETVGLGSNCYTLILSNFQLEAMKNLLPHILIRIAALIFLYEAYKAMKARQAADSTA